MPETLLTAARRYAEAHADSHGIARTPLNGLTIVRETTPTALQYAINKPLVALVLQGSKRVASGREIFDFSAGQSLLISADIPTRSQITRASLKDPYLSLVIDLDPAVIESLVIEMDSTPFTLDASIRVDETESEVADTALRLMRLLDRPSSLPILRTQLHRELHFWLLSGRHGGAIHRLGVTNSHAQRVAKAVAHIRANFTKPLKISQLAKAAGTSLSSLHEHFKAVTSLTPLQFQKQLRLIEARRMLLSEGVVIGRAAQSVGYESIPQFTREYARMFGQPPARDMKATRSRTHFAA